jgi:hypothetical protein
MIRRKDPVTTAEDLTLFLNEVLKIENFREGDESIQSVFALDGNANYYPFDRYGSRIWMMVTK